MNIVVRIALDRLEIELAGDLHHRLDPQAIDLDGLELTVNFTQRLDEVARGQMPREGPPLFPLDRTIAKDLAQVVDAFPDCAIGAARLDLIGPRSVLNALQSIRAQNGPDHAERQRNVDLEPAALEGTLVHPVLIDEEDPERLEADIPQCQLIALVILAETAGST